MEKTIFNITKMDCPSEEQLIRMKLQNFDTVKGLEFDIANRKLDVYHDGNPEPIFLALGTLNLNTTLVSTEKSNFVVETDTSNSQRKLLWTVLIINFVFFGLEMLFGIFSNSMGLVADSLDMLADILLAGLVQLGHFQLRQPDLALYLAQGELRQAVFCAVENQVATCHITHSPPQWCGLLSPCRSSPLWRGR